MRNFIIANPTLFPKSLYRARNITAKELREKVRFNELLSNDYDTKEKIVSFIAFIFRYQNKIICKKCGKKYPIKEGIPVMLIDEAED